MTTTDLENYGDTWSAEAILHAWGIAQSGRLSTARPRGWRNQNGEDGLDYVQMAARHCEKFFQSGEFAAWKEFAIHRYVLGKSDHEYVWQKPGESRMAALIRHGCGYLIDAPNDHVASRLMKRFAREFCAWYQANPYVSPTL